MSGIKKKIHMNPYDYHKYLINEYVLKKPGDTKYLYEKDKRNWKTDKDFVIENMKFIWNEDEQPESWEERLAKKYYDKLFREYCICDLSMYKENKIANRFRIEKEIISGKGQFLCGEKSCKEDSNLKTWEVNFAYVEKGVKRNALVKIRLCPKCSEKLNFHSKKREYKRLSKRKEHSRKSVNKRVEDRSQAETMTLSSLETVPVEESLAIEKAACEKFSSTSYQQTVEDESIWKKNQEIEVKCRDEEFDDYLNDLLL